MNTIAKSFALCLTLIATIMPSSSISAQDAKPGFVAGAPYALVKDQSQLHTPQISGRSAEELLDRIDKEAKRVSGRVVKLHVAAANQAAVDTAVAAIGKRYGNAVDKAPAVTLVEGALADKDAKLYVDAVIAFEKGSVSAPTEDDTFGRVLHPGPRLYISGQAEKGDSPEEATEKTLESLRKSLLAFESSLDHVVQVKGFLTDMKSAESVRAVFNKFMGGRKVPLVLVHWESSLPIEIELVAATTKRGSESVEYLTPPGMTTPTVYCRVARLSSPTTIYIGGMTATGAASDMPADAEVNNIFATLKSTLASSGSDLEQLVKATYYVSSEGTSTQLNVLRPNYYNPKRPPAASKAVVQGVGRPSRYLTVDMIATQK